MGKIAVILGGTKPHCRLINKLKDLGYFTILVDYLEKPIAKEFADIHIKESTLDEEKVYEICRKHNAELVISTCIDQANRTACIVAEKLGLHVPYSSETALLCTRKDLMKKRFIEYGINIAKFEAVREDNHKNVNISFPAVVKPVDCNSSKGVYRVDSPKEYREKISEAIAMSRAHTGIVEEFIEGTEIQVDCIVVEHKAYVLMTRDKSKLEDEGEELQISGFSVPGTVCKDSIVNIREIAQKIVDAFDLDNTPFFFQAIKTKQDIFVLEFAPRIAGGTTYDLVKQYCGYDIMDAAIASFMGKKINVDLSEKNKFLECAFIYMNSGVFDHVDGIKELLDDGIVTYYYEFVNSGTRISPSKYSGNRIAAVVVESDNCQASKDRLGKVMKTLKVIDPNGQNLMLRYAAV